ncbi:MAG: tetratricopeptide repeat protein, partial [Candidatus Omnitrophica bacterium]|nr:tetratricopeptide repeat protein [Candidatus Omnitrophota bacterium]
QDFGRAVRYYDDGFTSAGTDALRGVSLYRKGNAQFSAGDYADAAGTFKMLFERYRSHALAPDALGNMLLALYNAALYDRLVEEYAAYQASIVPDRKFFEVFYITAQGYLELGRYDEAVGVTDRLLSIANLNENERHKALVKKLEALIKAKKFADAGSLADTLLGAAGTDNDYVLFLKAETLYGLGDYKEAIVCYSRLQKEYPLSPVFDNAMYSMAYAKKSLGDNEDAAALFTRYFSEGKDTDKRREALYNAILIALKLNSVDKAIAQSKLFLSTFKESDLSEKVLFRLGMLYTDKKRYEDARDSFVQFVNIYQKSNRLDEAYFELGFNFQALKQYDEALVNYSKIAPLPNKALFYAALKNKAAIFIDKKDNEAACLAFDRIITEYPENDLDMDVYLWVAQYYDDHSRPEDVLRVLDKASLHQGASAHAKETAYFRAEAYRTLNDYPKAISSYDAVLVDNNVDVFVGAAHIGKGLIFLEMRDLDKADAEFNQAISKNPDDNTVSMRARFELATIAELRGKPDDALKLYMLIAILYTNDQYCPEALTRSAVIFESRGMRQEAENAYAEIVSKYPKSKAVAHAQKRLKALYAQ